MSELVGSHEAPPGRIGEVFTPHFSSAFTFDSKGRSVVVEQDSEADLIAGEVDRLALRRTDAHLPPRATGARAVPVSTFPRAARAVPLLEGWSPALTDGLAL